MSGNVRRGQVAVAVMAVAVMAVAVLVAGCVRRSAPAGAADAATPTDGAQAMPPPVSSDAAATADALVVSPGLGIGPVALGMSREAVEHLGLGAGTPTVGGRFVQYGAFDVTYTDGAPGGVASSIRLYVARARGGIRVSGTTLPANVSYAVLKEAVGACGPAQHNEGGNVTSCLGGMVEILQTPPTNDLLLSVRQGSKGQTP